MSPGGGMGGNGPGGNPGGHIAEGGEGSVPQLTSMPGFCFFHLVRRFWNQILTWVSVRLSESARLRRSQTER